MTDLNVRVQPGIIRIDSIVLTHRSEDAVVMVADTGQKYPEVLGGSTTQLLIGANKRTLGVKDPDEDDTLIEWDLPEGEWSTWADTGRYSIHIVCVRLLPYDDRPNETLYYDESQHP